jgi:hypothetical protein
MRLTKLLALVALVTVAGLTLAPSRAEDKKTPTIKEVMAKANKGNSALLGVLKKELAAQDINWDHVQEHAKELLDLSKALGKNEPPKGEKASWEKLTKQYEDNATALNKAAEKKERQAATDARNKLQGSCAGCHKLHRG